MSIYKKGDYFILLKRHGTNLPIPCVLKIDSYRNDNDFSSNSRPSGLPLYFNKYVTTPYNNLAKLLFIGENCA
jgi:hypothetical protein